MIYSKGICSTQFLLTETYATTIHHGLQRVHRQWRSHGHFDGKGLQKPQ